MNTFTHFNTKDLYNSFVEYTIDKVKDAKGTIIDISELHNELFNTDYFIFGYARAEEWLTQNVGIFYAIDLIKNYEIDNFGEVSTDLSSSEKVANMTAYILGEMLLNECPTMYKSWGEEFTEEAADAIISELVNLTC